MLLGIYCSGSFGRQILAVARDINKKEKRWDSFLFIDDSLSSKEVAGIEVVSFMEYEKRAEAVTSECVIAIGEPFEREKLYQKLTDSNLKLATFVEPSAKIYERTKIGQGTIILNNSVVLNDSVLEDNVIIQPFCVVGHDCIIGAHSVISAYVSQGGWSNIGKRTFVGMCVPIKNGINIGNDTIVSMGSVVVRNIPDNVIALGNPARAMLKNENHKVFNG